MFVLWSEIKIHYFLNGLLFVDHCKCVYIFEGKGDDHLDWRIWGSHFGSIKEDVELKFVVAQWETREFRRSIPVVRASVPNQHRLFLCSVNRIAILLFCFAHFFHLNGFINVNTLSSTCPFFSCPNSFETTWVVTFLEFLKYAKRFKYAKCACTVACISRYVYKCMQILNYLCVIYM